MPDQLHITNNDDRIINLLVECAFQEIIEAVEGEHEEETEAS
jgi:hypothetical protein